MKRFAVGLLAIMSGLVVGCNRPQQAAPVAKDGRPRLQRPGRLVSSPFLAQCQAVPVRGGRIAQLVDAAFDTDRGESVWGSRSFGSGGGGGGQEHYETTADYGGTFVFHRDGADRPVSAADADAILRALKNALEGELKESGVRIVDDKVTKDGMLVTGFSLGYEDPGMPAAGSIDGSIVLPKGIAGPERMAGLTLRHRETCRLDRVTGDK